MCWWDISEKRGLTAGLLTGRNTGIADDDGKRCTFYFNTSGSNKGAGFSGEKDGFLYYNGLLVTADGDSQYEVYQVDGKYYLVNESGKVQTNEKAYKSDGDYVWIWLRTGKFTIRMTTGKRRRRQTAAPRFRISPVTRYMSFDVL